MTELTSTAKKIMEVFQYVRIQTGDYLSTKILLTRRHLWRDIEEETFTDAIGELMERGYIARIENPEGWRLLEAGAEYLKELDR